MRDDRFESAMSILERFLNRRLLAGQIFHRQVMDLFPGGSKLSWSTQAFARAVEAKRREPRNPETGLIPLRMDERAAKRMMADARPVLALAVGACAWWGQQRCSAERFMREPRPSLESLLFTGHEWALPAIKVAEQERQLALEAGHRSASALIEFRIVTDFVTP